MSFVLFCEYCKLEMDDFSVGFNNNFLLKQK